MDQSQPGRFPREHPPGRLPQTKAIIDLFSIKENDKSPCPPIDKKDRRADAVGTKGWRAFDKLRMVRKMVSPSTSLRVSFGRFRIVSEVERFRRVLSESKHEVEPFVISKEKVNKNPEIHPPIPTPANSPVI